MYERAHCCDEAANHQLPIAAAVFVILHCSADREHWSAALLIVWPRGACLWWTPPSQSKIAATFLHLLCEWRSRRPLGLLFWIIAIDPPFIFVMTFLRKNRSLAAVWIKSLAAAAQCSFCSGSRSTRMNFAVTRFMPRSRIKISGTVVIGIPTSTSSSCTVNSLIFVDL